MSRERLTDKTASEVANDVYINESRTEGNKNVPMANGTPDTWAETPVSTQETAALHTEDTKRDEMNLHAIKQASDVEGRAVKCLVASQRMLPGADRGTLEANALDLMHLPVASIDGLLSRQETLARTLSASATKVAEECEEKKVEVEVEKEAAAPVAIEEKKDDTIEKLASQVAALTDMVAKMAEFKPFEKKEEKEEVKEEVKTASEADALEGIFSAVAPVSSKVGASSLSGMVRSASAKDEDVLAGLWND